MFGPLNGVGALPGTPLARSPAPAAAADVALAGVAAASAAWSSSRSILDPPLLLQLSGYLVGFLLVLDEVRGFLIRSNFSSVDRGFSSDMGVAYYPRYLHLSLRTKFTTVSPSPISYSLAVLYRT